MRKVFEILEHLPYCIVQDVRGKCVGGFGALLSVEV